MTAVAIYGTNRDEQQVRGSRSDYPSTQDRSAIRTCTATPTWMTTQLWPASPTARSRTRPQCGEMPPKFRQAFCAWAAWRTSRTATANRFTPRVHQNSSRKTPVGQQPHDAAPEALCSSFSASMQEIPLDSFPSIYVSSAQGFRGFPCVCHRPKRRRWKHERYRRPDGALHRRSAPVRYSEHHEPPGRLPVHLRPEAKRQTSQADWFLEKKC